MEDISLTLNEIALDLCILSDVEGGMFGEDELLRGWRTLKQNQPVPLWTVFAAQCFLDSHHILEENLSSGFSELQTFAAAAQDTLTKTLEVHNASMWQMPKRWHKSDAHLRDILQIIEKGVLVDALRSQLLKGQVSNN